MDLDRLNSVACRVGFFGAFVLLGFAILERGANLLGYTILGIGSYGPGRLAEFAAILLLFVIALLLRETRELLRGRSTTG